MKHIVLKTFNDIFGPSPRPSLFFAPGRVNLIGEHTDYNGGHVFPCALTLGTYAAVRKRRDRKLRFYSVNMPESGIIEDDLDDMRPLEDHEWTAYIKGVIWAFSESGIISAESSGACPCTSPDSEDHSVLQEMDTETGARMEAGRNSITNTETDAGRDSMIDTGMDIVIGGDLPPGAGLSSSASVEVLTGFILKELFGINVTLRDIALIGQYAENNYAGVNCGIMDQFASAMGKKDHAIFLDTSTLAFEYAPLDLKGCRLIITNTNKKHSLNESAYNDRRRECAEALVILNDVSASCRTGKNSSCRTDEKSSCRTDEKSSCKTSDISSCKTSDNSSFKTGDNSLFKTGGSSSISGNRNQSVSDSKLFLSLGELDNKQFEALSHGIGDPILQKRARHAVTENQRTMEAVRALNEGDIKRFGKLMNASHVSLQDDYEVSCPELDLLAETAWSIPGVIGSRMTGGGFGGCTVSIVEDAAVDKFRSTLQEAYRSAFGYDCTFYEIAIGGGPVKL